MLPSNLINVYKIGVNTHNLAIFELGINEDVCGSVLGITPQDYINFLRNGASVSKLSEHWVKYLYGCDMSEGSNATYAM